MKKIALGIIVIAIMIPIYLYLQKAFDKTSNFKEYSNLQYGFSFKYPKDYKFEETSLKTGQFVWEVNIQSTDMLKGDNVRDLQNIAVSVRTKSGLSFDDWIKKECNPINITDITVSGLPAKKFECVVGNESNNKWVEIAIDKGNYMYTLSDIGFNKNSYQEGIFNQIVSTYKISN